ncbi:MAG: alpha/beta hydrolase [Aquabacterium sp.]|jgi:pimeloyl-ACP methyl ester carboxylesterase|uniref:alpha/beta fold hydrolase n=1 Tax=Aquabacterium sp. TaxID=1872578 RepID=UPI002A369A49|nr:alpha/beta hydrolase [Aquabacterium sp.]MDX9843120.1 alpha/beta hydrolase [Aquabacterium sp.]
MNWFKRLWWSAVVLALVLAGAIAWSWEPDRQLGQLVARWAPEPSRFIELDGMQVHIRDTGPRNDAAPLLLLHGMSSSLHSFEGWQSALQGERRVISVDLPGFGLTGPSPQGDYRIEVYSRFVLRLLDTLEVKRVVLAGNALGGEIAWQTALLAPERVQKLILIDADGYQPAVLSMPLGFQIASMRGLRWVSERILPRPLMAASLRSVFGEPERVTRERIDRYFELNLRVGNRRALFQRMDQATFGESAPLIRRITQPTLVLWGERDEMISPDLGSRFCEDIPRCRLVTFPQLGHLPQEEDPAATLQAVRPFLAS